MTDAWGDEPPEPVERVGAWSARVIGGGLDDLTIGGAVVLRSVRVVVRDHDWRTVPVIRQRVEADGAALRLEFRAEGFGADLGGVLTARDDGDSLVVAAEVEARAAFRRNRIGIVVLHAPALAGVALQVGDTTTSFPDRISPHQPARDVHELRWRADGRANRVGFDGEVFEMEDQRNWTDASYKTYGTPLQLPFPVDVAPGHVVRQSVRITSVPDAAASVVAAGPSPGPTVVELADGGGRMPQLAVGASTAADADLPGRMPRLPAEAVLVELRAADAGWRAALQRARRDAAGLPLDVRVVAGSGGDLTEVLDALDLGELVRLGAYDPVSHVTEPPVWRALVDGARDRGIPSSVLVAGTRAHFTELNRTHERIDHALPALTFSVTPQMHDRATRQLVESIRMQRLVARDARAIAGDRPVHVGPITLRARANFVATTTLEPDARPDLRDGYGPARDPETVDPRQHAPALEAWIVASVAAFAAEGVASATYFEAWGPRGIHREGGSPAWRALELLAAFRGAELLRSDAPDGIAVLATRGVGGLRALVASLRPEPATVVLRADGVEHRVRAPEWGVAAVDVS